MKCPKCGFNNKKESKICKKCGENLITEEPIWKPSLFWYIKVLIVIYVILIIIFFTLNHLLKPFMRTLPQDITPWLQKNEKSIKR